jgi:deazaflavin-dependent oxidoreductase (nitroreductase family)
MKITDLIVRFAVSSAGAAFDRHVVRYTGHSFVSFAFARAYGVDYNAPLLLTTIGARTAKKRSVVLPLFQAGKHLAVVGSKGGMRSDPHWVHNLRANPEVWIRVDRKLRPARARIAMGQERVELWREITALAPVYLSYQENCRKTREIPVVVLESCPTR